MKRILILVSLMASAVALGGVDTARLGSLKASANVVTNVSGFQAQLTAGTNITIVGNVISASGGGGITTNNVLDLISGKQDKLTAGENITIVTNVQWETSQYGTAYTRSIPAVGSYVTAYKDADCTTATFFDAVACTNVNDYVAMKGSGYGQGTVTLVGGNNIISATGGEVPSAGNGLVLLPKSIYYQWTANGTTYFTTNLPTSTIYAPAYLSTALGTQAGTIAIGANGDYFLDYMYGATSNGYFEISKSYAVSADIARVSALSNEIATVSNLIASVKATADSAVQPGDQIASASSADHATAATWLGGITSGSGYQYSDVASMAAQISSIGTYLNAEDAHFVSTNYDSIVRIPEAYVEIKMSNDWITIWRENTRWDRFTGASFDWTTNNTWAGFAAWKTNVESEINFKAERSWGIYDSETGGYSPEGYTQVSSSNILIASGMSYQRTVTTDGSVWVLQCNQGVANISGDTNGYFRIMDSDGNVQFEIIKGDKRVIGANASGITVNSSTSPATVTIPYSVVAAEHPTLYCCTNLSAQNWQAETASACPANVTWTGSSGAYVATVQLKQSGSQLFCKATYEAGGETYINNVAPVGMDSIYLNGTKYYLGTATIDGHTVLTLSTTAPSN